MILTFDVQGIPAPKGSLRHVGGGRLVEQVKASRPWMTKVRAAALAAAADCGWTHDGQGVRVTLELVVPRPKSVRRPMPVKRSAGDLDKHCRSVLDALTADARHGLLGVLTDDSAVVDLVASKRYPSGERPFIGAVIRIEEVPA